MSDLKEMLERAERAVAHVTVPADGLDRLARRRDRRRRRQRTTAGLVGVAISVGAIMIPATGWLSAPAPTGPVALDAPYGGPFIDLPPEGAEPSTPEVGQLVASSAVPCRIVRRRCPGPGALAGWVRVYADGRVISFSEMMGPRPHGYRLQQLSPEGVELVRSGAVRPQDLLCSGQVAGATCGSRPHQVPETAWSNETMEPYVPSRYAVCPSHRRPTFTWDRIMRQLPSTAQDVLRGRKETFDVVTGGEMVCADVSIGEARRLDGVLTDAGFFWRTTMAIYERTRLLVSPDPHPGLVLWVTFLPVLPDGTV